MNLFKFCPKTHRIIGVRSPRDVPRLLFPIAGFLALVWFLVRVVPKPSRATYPCQKVAGPLAGSFLMWLVGITGASLLFHKARARLRQARYLPALLALLGALAVLSWSAFSLHQSARAAYTPHPANSPIGTARGLIPGRVTWAYDPLVTDWNGTAGNASQSWFNHTSQSEATNLMQWALMNYAGRTTTSAAWDAIFHYFNGGSAGYQSGEKIFIKINMTTSQADACADSSYNWTPSSCSTSWSSVGESPQLMIALLDQLVNVVGVTQSDITIGDPTGLWVNELYNPVHSLFPNVVYMDARGTLGRTKATKSTTRLYWSTTEANGKTSDYLLQAVVDARYMINLSVLKSHERNGITVAAKNHFGSLSGGNDNPRKPNTTGYYNLHLRLPLETASDAWPQRASMAQYRPLVDLNGDTGMGGKTLLYLVDGIFGGQGWSGAPSKWAMAPFNNNWPSSLFVSMDEVAIDSVAFDFLSQQFPTQVLGAEGVQDYLHEMAQADNPPSGTFYDPENDGLRMTSLGVHEHWNNATDKQYTRNLGTGSGIELVYADGPYVSAQKVRDDYDGDGKTDAVKFDPAAGIGWWLKSSTGLWDGKWLGSDSFDYVSASDFDGDGQTDPAKFYSGTGTVWWAKSSTGTLDGQWLGPDLFTYITGSDFDGDGSADPAKFYPGTGTVWWVKSTTGLLDGQWLGPDSFTYVSGSDFDGDGKSDPAKFYPATGTLWWVKSTTGVLDGKWLGPDTFTVVPASDFDGDGRTDPAKFYSDTGNVWWVKSSTGSMDGAWMGSGTFTYVPGCDFNGDGKTDPAKYDAGTHTLSWLNVGTGTWTDIDTGTGTYVLSNGQ